VAKRKVPAALAAHQFGKSSKKAATGGKAKKAAKKSTKPPWLK
jgi:hypothetical protein